MFNAEIDIQNHNSFVQHLMVIFNMDKDKAEKAVLQMEKDVEEMWNNPEEYYKRVKKLNKE
jgi:ethanolamine utilization cobalamin adenosyltransferase